MKSSLSNPNGACVDVYRLPDGNVLVLHSKRPDEPGIIYSPEEWDAFTGGVMNGEFTRDKIPVVDHLPSSMARSSVKFHDEEFGGPELRAAGNSPSRETREGITGLQWENLGHGG